MSRTMCTIAAIAVFSMPTVGALAALDTTALMPPGNYVLRVTVKQGTLEQPVIISRSGSGVKAALGGSESLDGSIDSARQLQLAGSNGKDRIELTAPVQNGRASGRALLVRDASRMTGTFTLEPMMSARAKMKEYQAPPSKTKTQDCGFFCKVGRFWDCLKDWSKC